MDKGLQRITHHNAQRPSLFYLHKGAFLILRNDKARSMAGSDCTQKRENLESADSSG